MTYKPNPLRADPKPEKAPKKKPKPLKRTAIKPKLRKEGDSKLYGFNSTIKKSGKPLKKKPEAGSRAFLEIELDRVFSVCLRRSLADDKHRVKCFTCETRMNWKFMHCGHFRGRRNHSTRWHLMNCHPQCEECNVHKGGNLDVYAENLNKKYHPKASEELEYLSRQVKKFTEDEMEERIFECKEMIKEMDENEKKNEKTGLE